MLFSGSAPQNPVKEIKSNVTGAMYVCVLRFVEFLIIRGSDSNYWINCKEYAGSGWAKFLADNLASPVLSNLTETAINRSLEGATVFHLRAQRGYFSNAFEKLNGEYGVFRNTFVFTELPPQEN
jgi:hypothetical protein